MAWQRTTASQCVALVAVLAGACQQVRQPIAFNHRVRVVFPAQKQSVILHPSTPAPRYRLLLESERGARAGLSINIFTGTPEQWKPSEEDLR